MVLPFLIPLGVALAKEFVPDLIGELVGPGAEKVAEKLVGVATELTGEQDPEKILVAMRADKEMAAKLSIQMSEERIAMAEADQKDRASARRMASKGGILTAAPVAVSVISTIGFFGAVAVVLVVNVPDGSKEVVFTLLGIAGAGYTKVLDFWLGSSHGSKLKTMLFGDAAKTDRVS